MAVIVNTTCSACGLMFTPCVLGYPTVFSLPRICESMTSYIIPTFTFFMRRAEALPK